MVVAVPVEHLSTSEGLFAKAWSGCSQQHILACKGGFHDVSSTTPYRGHANPRDHRGVSPRQQGNEGEGTCQGHFQQNAKWPLPTQQPFAGFSEEPLVLRIT